MYKCENCSSALKYNIVTGKLQCEYCNACFPPYHFQTEQSASQDTFETTTFTCSQCGAKIISEDTTLATFCSFCGTPAYLKGHTTRETCPKYIIPFYKTKEDCKKSYQKLFRFAPFTPNGLKDPESIENFRGIYMPYWLYSYKGALSEDEFSADASSSFADDLSEAIAPFHTDRKKPFTPAYLSGFYADTNDVPSSVYHGGNPLGSLLERLHSSDAHADLALFPVWFLSYRKGDRIAYAAVNGQTGKASADFPIDEKKYILGSLILAVPIFVFLSSFFTIKPPIVLLISAILALLCAVISKKQLLRIQIKESGQDDKGKMASARFSSDTEYTIRKWPTLIKPVLAILLSAAIFILNPVADIYYYAGAIVCMCMVCWSFTDIFKYHNILATRKLPQFHERGGDEFA